MPIVGTVEHSNDTGLFGWNARRNVAVHDYSRLAGLENHRLTASLSGVALLQFVKLPSLLI